MTGPGAAMPGEGTGAVVVTYHPDEDVLENLRLLRPQVDCLVVVDNGSSERELRGLRQAAADGTLQLIENGSNLGVATALNAGVRHLLQRKLAWVVLFDQDSRVTPGFIAAMLRGFVAAERHCAVGLMVPVYTDLRTGSPIPPDRLPAGGLEVTITSGSLLRAETLARLGPFVDELFIDGVDHEYSLRLRRAGCRLLECAAATLLHSPGTPRTHRVGNKRFLTANYSPLRRYYQERNKLWIARRYFFSFPRFCLRMLLVSLKDLVKIWVAEPDDKWTKTKFFARGVLDGIRGRYGKLER